MILTPFNESIVEDAALAWLGGKVYSINPCGKPPAFLSRLGALASTTTLRTIHKTATICDRSPFRG